MTKWLFSIAFAGFAMCTALGGHAEAYMKDDVVSGLLTIVAGETHWPATHSFGRVDVGSYSRIAIPPNYVLRGLYGNSGALLDRIGLIVEDP